MRAATCLCRQGAGAEAPVNAYTQVARQTKRLLRMIAQTRSMQIVTTHSEAEALLLEAQLIKRYRPPYNVLLRDDKSFPFILLREDHDFPRVQLHRGARRLKGQYYGPFASAGSVRNTLNSLQKLFLLRSCTDSFFANRTRPCLLHQIRRCSAPCVGRVDEAGYDELVRDAKDFLGGRSTKIQQKLGRQMSAASEAMDFELAAVYRDRWRAPPMSRAAGDPRRAARRRRHFRARLQGRDDVHPGLLHSRRPRIGAPQLLPAHTNDVPEAEVLQSFLVQFYEEVPPPRLVLTDRRIPESELLCEALSERAERKVALKVPQRGDQARMIRRPRATPRRSSTAASPRPRPRRAICARSPRRSSWPSRRSGSRSTTTAM